MGSNSGFIHLNHRRRVCPCGKTLFDRPAEISFRITQLEESTLCGLDWERVVYHHLAHSDRPTDPICQMVHNDPGSIDATWNGNGDHTPRIRCNFNLGIWILPLHPRRHHNSLTCNFTEYGGWSLYTEDNIRDKLLFNSKLVLTSSISLARGPITTPSQTTRPYLCDWKV